MEIPVSSSPPETPPPTSLAELARLFLRLGCTAFGGPAAHLTLMQKEAVEKRRWMNQERFLDLVGACNLLPGPGSTQVAMALGFTRRRWPGLLISGVCFILPASLSTLALAWAYARFGGLHLAQGLLYAAKPVMLAILAQAIWVLGRSAWRALPLAALGIVCGALAALGVHPLLVLLGAGGLSLSHRANAGPHSPTRKFAAVLSFPRITLASAGAVAGGIGLLPILGVFLKLGVTVFGSGYVLLAFLQADLVNRLHWVTSQQLLDAVTAGQLTPGPVFATATFLGFLLRGWSGAAVATLAIFLPSFLMAGLAAAWVEHIRRSKLASGFLDGVNAAAVGLMAAVSIPLGRASLVDTFTWGIAIICALLLIRFRVNPTWLIVGAAAMSLVLHSIPGL